MLATLLKKRSELRKERATDDRGFTLIELLVVVVIIGILIAIAIPLFQNYKKGAENKSAQSDARNAIPVIEQYFADKQSVYPNATGGYVTGTTCLNLDASPAAADTTCGTNHTVKVGSGNVLAILVSGSNYYICSASTDGGNTYRYDSATGSWTQPTTARIATITATLC